MENYYCFKRKEKIYDKNCTKCMLKEEDLENCKNFNLVEQRPRVLKIALKGKKNEDKNKSSK